MNEIVGRSMSSVEFVQDYIQFRFDGPCLTTLTLPSLKRPGEIVQPADQGYRDSLCSQIGIQVEGVDLSNEELIVRFVNSVAIVVSLRVEHYTGPEAINYVGENGAWVVG
jgi:hypothetical protein